MNTTRRGDDRGVVTVWSVVVVAACVVMIGLVLDGGVILRGRSDAYSLAAEAARAGAQQLDQNAAAQGNVALDPNAARTAALTFLVDRGATGDVTVTANTITVTTHRTVALQILRPASITVTATATVAARTGGP
ncbi:MAG: hypothetical protein QOI95_2118 [Acidimicrobiaceae bacterium]